MYSKKTREYEPLKVDGRIKITKKIFDEIRKIKYIPKEHADKAAFYEKVAKKYNISAGSVTNIQLSDEADVDSYYRTKMRFTSLGLNKIITEEMAIDHITELYINHFKKKPTKVSARDKYGVMQVVILPEMIFFQLNEQCLTNEDIFEKVTNRSFRDAVIMHDMSDKTRKVTLQQMKDISIEERGSNPKRPLSPNDKANNKQ